MDHIPLQNAPLPQRPPFHETTHLAGSESLPVVRLSNGFLATWDTTSIVKQLIKETKLATSLYGIEPISIELGIDIANDVRDRIQSLHVKAITGSAIREFVNVVLIERGFEEYARVCSRVGTSLYDAHGIDHGNGFESHENSNLTPNPETSAKKKHDKLSKQQALLMLPSYISDAHLSGCIHIHDLEYATTRPFCADYDLRYFFYYGLMPDGTGAHASVARHANSPEVAILHAVKALAAGQTNCAGGQGFYNFLTFLAPYLHTCTYREIKQLMQEAVYELTQMFIARGGQTVFSSLQLTPGVPELWKDRPVVVRGQVRHDLRYGDFEREVRLAFKAIMEVLIEGDSWGKPFNFPKAEVAIEPCFLVPREEDIFYAHEPDIPTLEDNYVLAGKLAAKFGGVYFDNMLPAYRGSGKGISCYQCCSYMFKVERADDPDFDAKLNFEGGAHFSMGAWHVVTINVPRCAYKANHDTDKFIDELKNAVDLAVEFFKIKKQWMQPIIDEKRLPFLQQTPPDPTTGKPGTVLYDFDSLVYTVGVVGLDNAINYHTGNSMHEDNTSWLLGVSAILELQKYCQEKSEELGSKIALARTPAESCSQRLAVADIINPEFVEAAATAVEGDVESGMRMYVHNGETDLPIYYSNGTHVPVGADADIFERIRIEEVFYHGLTGGDLTHLFIGEAHPVPEGLIELVMNIARKTQIGYIVPSRDLTVCLSCRHIEGGLHECCVNCGDSNVEYIARVTGYMSTVSSWNAAKRQELKDRRRIGVDGRIATDYNPPRNSN